jgi:nucleoside phosphorylase
VTATRREAAWLPFGTLVAGSGSAAAETLRARIEAKDVDVIVTAGLCGGLDPSLRPGALVLSRVVLYGEERLESSLPIYVAARAALRPTGADFVSAILMTVDRPLASRRAKAAVWNQTGAAGVDMETYHLARIADAANLPWLALRVVIDPAEASLPEPMRDWSGEADERGIAGRLLLRPQDWPAALRLGVGLRKAGRVLAEASRTVDSILSNTQLEVPEPRNSEVAETGNSKDQG